MFASKRGTYDRSGPGFKGDVTGSDKNTAFRLPCRPELNAVLVFEAPIDLMSYCTLHRQVTSNAVACADSMRGRWIHTCGRIRSSGTLSCAWTQMSRASLQWNAAGQVRGRRLHGAVPDASLRQGLE